MGSRLVPDLRFPEFVDNWIEKKLGEIAETVGGGTPSTSNSEYWGGDIIWLTPTEITEKYVSQSRRKITELGMQNSPAKIIPKGSLLFTSRATIGNISIALEDCTTNQGFQTFLQNETYIVDFLYNWIKINRNAFICKSSGSTFLEISKSEIAKINIFIPSLPEQVKIATFLTAIDKRITLLKEKKKLTNQYKKGLMQKIFSQEIRFKDENGNDFLEWEDRSFGEVCRKKSSNISANSLNKNGGEYKIYGASGLLQYIDFYKEEAPYISIVKDGAGVGRISLCKSKSSVLGTLDVLKPKENNDLYFIFLLLGTIHFSKYITGSTIPHIYFRDYSKEKVKIPSEKEQQKIANLLSLVDKLIRKLNNQVEKSKAFKHGLLQKMFF